VSFRLGGVGDATGELAVVAAALLRLRVASPKRQPLSRRVRVRGG